MAAKLATLGIEVEVIPTASSKEFFEKLVAADYDMTLAGWVTDTAWIRWNTSKPCSFPTGCPSWDNLAVLRQRVAFLRPAARRPAAQLARTRAPRTLERDRRRGLVNEGAR